jgi:hypothetical protein
MSGAPASPFPADALAANQGGLLTDAQRQTFRGQDHAFRKNELIGGLVAIVIGILMLTAGGPNPNAWLQPVVAIAAFLIAAGLIFRSTIGGDSLGRDLARGSVEAIEGAILKNVRSTSGGKSSSERFELHVSGKSFDVSRSVYNVAPQAGYVRVYYLPRSRTLVNLEQLPDRPLPTGTMDSAGTLAKGTLAGLTSHDENAQAEALAEMAVLRKSFQEGVVPGTVEAPADQHDQPPLAGAIVGTWRAGPISMTFAADGTMTTDLPGGRGQPGHWSIDASGELHAQFAGRDMAGEAWVSGTTLTIKADGEAREFQRVGVG